MIQWWKDHETLDMGPYTKAEIEYQTGCNPLVLKRCTDANKFVLLNDFVESICDNVFEIIKTRHKSGHTSNDWSE